MLFHRSVELQLVGTPGAEIKSLQRITTIPLTKLSLIGYRDDTDTGTEIKRNRRLQLKVIKRMDRLYY